MTNASGLCGRTLRFAPRSRFPCRWPTSWSAWGQPDASTQRIDFVSDYVETMLGYTVEEWLSTPNFWLTIVHPDDREEPARVTGESFNSGKGSTQQFRWAPKDGCPVWVESNYQDVVRRITRHSLTQSGYNVLESQC